MPETNANVQKLADAIFKPEVLNNTKLWSQQPYGEMIQQLSIKVDEIDAAGRKMLEEKKAHYASKGAKMSAEDIAVEEKVIEANKAKYLQEQKARFIAVYENKVMPDLSWEGLSEKMGHSSGWGAATSAFSAITSGGNPIAMLTSGLTGTLHHMALAMGMDLTPVKKFMAQAKNFVLGGGLGSGNWSDAWQKAGVQANKDVRASGFAKFAEESALKLDENDIKAMAELNQEQMGAEVARIESVMEGKATGKTSQSGGVDSQQRFEELLASLNVDGENGIGKADLASLDNANGKKDGKLTLDEIFAGKDNVDDSLVQQLMNYFKEQNVPIALDGNQQSINLNSLDPNLNIPLLQATAETQK